MVNSPYWTLSFSTKAPHFEVGLLIGLYVHAEQNPSSRTLIIQNVDILMTHSQLSACTRERS